MKANNITVTEHTREQGKHYTITIGEKVIYQGYNFSRVEKLTHFNTGDIILPPSSILISPFRRMGMRVKVPEKIWIIIDTYHRYHGICFIVSPMLSNGNPSRNKRRFKRLTYNQLKMLNVQHYTKS